MATRRIERSAATRTRLGAAAIYVTITTAGCAVNPVFESRFSHCIQIWNAQERPDSTVYPEGFSKTDHCYDWARKSHSIGTVSQSVPNPNPTAMKGH